MSVCDLETDEEALEKAADIQEATLATLRRIQATNEQTKESGVHSLIQLKEQRDQFDRVFEAADRLDTGLQKTEQLQNRLSVWSLRLNSSKRSARRQVDQQRADARKLAQEHATLIQQRLKQQQQQNNKRSDDDEEEYSKPSFETQNNHQERKTFVKKKKYLIKVPEDDPLAVKKDLLFGVDTTGGEHQEKLQQLNEVDQEIDEALTVVATQVDTILTMGREIKSEIVSHNTQMGCLSDRVERAQYKQEVINKRTTKFLDGNVRHQHQMVDTLSSPRSVVTTSKTLLEI